MMKLIMISISIIIMIKNLKMIKLIIQNYIFFMFLILLFNYNLTNFYWSKIYYIFSFDNINFNLTLLTIWILSLSLMSSNIILNNKFFKKFILLIMMLMLFLMMCFLSINMLMFYIFFESSLIPIMMLIMGWGTQINRIQASMYMLFYTLFGSLPLFIMIIYLKMKFSSMMFNMMILNSNLNNLNFIMYLMLIIAFMIKMPLYFIHLWLPKAHVEAPISGSMILAGIMLKLGSYGMLRFMMILPMMFMKFNYLIIMISLMGSLYASLICINQIDLKIIVAYSSVVHMSLLNSSLMTMNYWGYSGSFLMMLAHGLCSSIFFNIVNLNYERIKSRNLIFNKGMINILPSLSLWWFLISASNFSAPPSLNFFSELMLLNSLVIWSKSIIIILMLTAFFSTCYSVYIYSINQHGNNLINLFNFKMINCHEFLIILLHWFPLNFMFINMNIFI
uniref:NADH-ubiquinone oxidoreductase chain 4 n=1 Tax=Homolobus sp. QL-2013 TaxID=1421595 RepID=A0A0A6ZLU9_9HYME|nr:NADH dehydrogenase subunit 4 [Homolobus sp. QL-2013]